MLPPYIIFYAIVLHVCWGVTLLFSNIPTNITAVHQLASIFKPTWFLGVVLILAAVGALVGLRAKPSKFQVVYLMPQQFLLTISAVGATTSIFNGAFADGVIRSPLFIFTDQLPAILIAVFHTLAMIYIGLKNRELG